MVVLYSRKKVHYISYIKVESSWYYFDGMRPTKRLQKFMDISTYEPSSLAYEIEGINNILYVTKIYYIL